MFNGFARSHWGSRNYTSANTCAANNPETPQAACGSGYKVIDWAALGSAGATYLLYRDGTNCVATIKHTSIGTASATPTPARSSTAAEPARPRYRGAGGAAG